MVKDTMKAVKGSVLKVGISAIAALFLIIGVWTYCALWAPPPVSGFTQQATLEMAHACGIHAFDPPAGKDSADAAPLKVTDLPEGSYIYTGTRPVQAAPRWVVVNPGGTITWADVKPSATPPPATPASSTSAPASGSAGGKKPARGVKAAAQIGDTHFETYNYPMVKWEAKPLNGKGAVAQLWTTYDRPSPRDEGVVKYRLTLFKSPGGETHRIQLLDDGGFKILEFKASDFQDVPGTELTEARESFSCPEEQYRQARDYAIN